MHNGAIHNGFTAQETLRQLTAVDGAGSLFDADFLDSLSSAAFVQVTDVAFAAWTPTVTSTSGTITTVGALNCRYAQIGKTVILHGSIVITTNGTGAGKINVTLPSGPGNANGQSAGAGRANSVSGKGLQVHVISGSQNMRVANFDDSYPAADGETLCFMAVYEGT